MDDLISRRKALDTFRKSVCNGISCHCCPILYTSEAYECKLGKWIRELPPAKSIGYWIEGAQIIYRNGEEEYARSYVFECSECGAESPKKSKFCWECGARMMEWKNG